MRYGITDLVPNKEEYSALSAFSAVNDYYSQQSWFSGAKMSKLKGGLVQIYTGQGKGKTTAAFGQALRALGQGLKVCIVQFMKKRKSGELIALKRLFPEVRIKQFGAGEWVKKGKPTPKDIQLAQKAFEFSRQAMLSQEYDMIILDELNFALNCGLLRLSEVLKLIREKPKNVELILTGRNAPKELIQVADLVSEMKKIKHPYDKGIKARKGIEF